MDHWVLVLVDGFQTTFDPKNVILSQIIIYPLQCFTTKWTCDQTLFQTIQHHYIPSKLNLYIFVSSLKNNMFSIFLPLNQIQPCSNMPMSKKWLVLLHMHPNWLFWTHGNVEVFTWLLSKPHCMCTCNPQTLSTEESHTTLLFSLFKNSMTHSSLPLSHH